MPKRAELKLSRSVVDGLSVEGGDRVFWDRALPGFGVRVHGKRQPDPIQDPA